MAAMMIPLALQVGSTLLNMKSNLEQGQQAYKDAYAQANELEAEGDAALASATRQAGEARREGDAVMSDATAAMVAGGGVSDDAGAIETLSAIDQRTKFNSMAALFEGRTARRGRYRQAGRLRKEGRQALKTGRTRAVGNLLSGGASAYDYAGFGGDGE